MIYTGMHQPSMKTIHVSPYHINGLNHIKGHLAMSMQTTWPIKDGIYSMIIDHTRQHDQATGASSQLKLSTHATRNHSSRTPQRELRLNYKRQFEHHDLAKRINNATPISNGAVDTLKKRPLLPGMIP